MKNIFEWIFSIFKKYFHCQTTPFETKPFVKRFKDKLSRLVIVYLKILHNLIGCRVLLAGSCYSNFYVFKLCCLEINKSAKSAKFSRNLLNQRLFLYLTFSSFLHPSLKWHFDTILKCNWFSVVNNLFESLSVLQFCKSQSNIVRST